MQDKLKEVLEKHNISSEILEDILAEFSEEYLPKSQIDEQILTEKNKILINTSVLNALNQSKARNIKACCSLIDYEKITTNGSDEVLGVEEEISKLKKENPYLFEEEQTPYTPKGNKKDTEDMSDEEYFSFLKYRGGK